MMMKMVIAVAMGIYRVSTMSRAASVLAKQFTSVILFKLHNPPSGRYCYYPHFTDGETGAKRFK